MSIKIGRRYLLEYEKEPEKLLFYDLKQGLPTKPIFVLPMSKEIAKDFKKWTEKEILKVGGV